MPKGLRPITTYNVYGGTKAITRNAAHTSQFINLTETAQDGMFSLHWVITGSANITLTYTVCSISDGTYFTPSGGGTIPNASALTVTTGGGVTFEPEMYPFIKLVATENNVAAGTLVLYLNVQ